MKMLLAFLVIWIPGSLLAEGPQLDADVVNGGKTFKKEQTTKIIITDFSVSFATFNAQASKSGKFSSQIGTSNISLNVWLRGIDPAVMQELTDMIYAKYLEDLRAKGLEPVGQETLAATGAYKKVKNTVAGGGEPFAYKIDQNEYLLFTPRALSFPGGERDKNGTYKPDKQAGAVMMEVKAMSASATFVLDIVDFATRGGLFANSAHSVSARPAIVSGDRNGMGLTTVVKYVPGIIGVSLKERYASEMDLAGELVETKSASFAGSSFANYDLTPTVESFRAGAVSYLNAMEGAMLIRLTEELQKARSK